MPLISIIHIFLYFYQVMAVSESSRLRASLKKENVPVKRLIVNQILPPSASDCKFCAMKRKVSTSILSYWQIICFQLHHEHNSYSSSSVSCLMNNLNCEHLSLTQEETSFLSIFSYIFWWGQKGKVYKCFFSSKYFRIRCVLLIWFGVIQNSPAWHWYRHH